VQAGAFRVRPIERGALKAIRGDNEDLRAMKRALANAPLGPKATLALSSAVIALEEDDDLFERLEVAAG